MEISPFEAEAIGRDIVAGLPVPHLDAIFSERIGHTSVLQGYFSDSPAVGKAC